MIVRKTWERWSTDRRANGRRYHDTFTGYFLVGILPLYIHRHRTRSN